MAYNFVECNREQLYLLPPSLQDWLPEKDLAWFILDAVDEMDLSQFYAAYRQDGWGGEAYEPKMMVALLLYAYCLGERSSRRIERLCERDIAFRVIAANLAPDHATIARFRAEHREALAGLFTAVLRLCREAGLVKVGVVALDGTKVKANAALSANRSYEHLEEEVGRMFSEADARDAEEDRLYGQEKRGDELPEELRDRGSRLARLKACKARLAGEALAAAAEQAKKIVEHEAEGKRGRKPSPVSAAPPSAAKANVTDPESRVMKTAVGYVQGYNAQAVVNEEQIIIAAEVTQEANDVQQLQPMLEQAEKNLAAVGVKEKVGVAVADAGYCSEENLKAACSGSPELFIATAKDWQERRALREAPPPRGRIPKGLSLRERMARKLRTKRGKQLYPLRGVLVEPVFGQIKETRGCDRFMRRGLTAVNGEWKLVSTTHNLLKLWRRACWQAGRGKADRN